MKRDMDLVREILLAAENLPPDAGEVSAAMLKSLGSKQVVAAHVQWLEEAGLIDASVLRVEGMNYPATFSIYRLTWEGADFLESIRDKAAWEHTKKIIASRGGAMTFDIVKAVATAYLKSSLGLDA